MNFWRSNDGTRLLWIGGVAVYVSIVPFVMAPLSWAVFGSFKPQNELFRYPPTLLPENFTLQGYQIVLFRTEFFQFLVQTLVITSISTVLTVLLASLAAYGFSRWDFRLKSVTMLTLLLCQLIPTSVTIIPYYLMMSFLNLLDTFAGLVLIFTATHIPFALWIMKSHIDSIPKSMDEAATIDGASRLYVLRRIILPLALPGIGAASALTFIAVWGEFLIPRVIANSPNLSMVSAAIYSHFGPESTTFYDRLFASTVVATIPVVIVYLMAQKQFISGLASGGEK